MSETAGTRRVVGGDMSIAAQVKAIGHKPLKTDWSTRWECLGTDADLGTEAVAEAVSKSCRAVVIDTCTVDCMKESLRS